MNHYNSTQAQNSGMIANAFPYQSTQQQYGPRSPQQIPFNPYMTHQQQQQTTEHFQQMYAQPSMRNSYSPNFSQGGQQESDYQGPPTPGGYYMYLSTSPGATGLPITDVATWRLLGHLQTISPLSLQLPYPLTMPLSQYNL